MFQKQSSKNHRMRSAETPDAHHPEDQIINKTFDKTKEKVYFSRSLRLPDASINEKMGGYRRLQPAACFGGTVANGPISDTERLCWQKACVCCGLHKQPAVEPLHGGAWQANAVWVSVYRFVRGSSSCRCREIAVIYRISTCVSGLARSG